MFSNCELVYFDCLEALSQLSNKCSSICVNVVLKIHAQSIKNHKHVHVSSCVVRVCVGILFINFPWYFNISESIKTWFYEVLFSAEPTIN